MEPSVAHLEKELELGPHCTSQIAEGTRRSDQCARNRYEIDVCLSYHPQSNIRDGATCESCSSKRL